MDDAKVLTSSERDKSYGGTASIPLPDPSSVTALLQIMPQLSAHKSSNRKLACSAQIIGTRIYPAQFQRLDVRYLATEDGRDPLPNQINLLNIFSAQEHRGESQVAEISVQAGLRDSEAQENEGDEARDEGQEDEGDEATYEKEFNEDYWKAFNEQLDEVKAEFE